MQGVSRDISGPVIASVQDCEEQVELGRGLANVSDHHADPVSHVVGALRKELDCLALVSLRRDLVVGSPSVRVGHEGLHLVETRRDGLDVDALPDGNLVHQGARHKDVVRGIIDVVGGHCDRR